MGFSPFGGVGGGQIPVLHTHQTAFTIIIRYLQPRHALLVFPRGEPTPANHALIQTSLLEQKLTCLLVQPRMLKEPLVATGVEQTLPRPLSA
jgi:hypothetical protein